MSAVVGRMREDRGAYGVRVTVVCSCGMETVQRWMDAPADFCGRCGYMNEPAVSA